MHTFRYQGRTYHWNNYRWMDDSYLQVDDKLAQELEKAYPRPQRGPREIAQLRQDAKTHNRKAILHTAGRPDPNDPASVAAFSGLYRDLGQHDKALAVTEAWKMGTHPVVLTARAAVLCDMKRHNEAETMAKKAVLMGGGWPAQRVLGRILRERQAA